MSSRLNPKQLFEQILQAVDSSGWQSLVLNVSKPFQLRLFKSDEKAFDVRIYLWNCTHGGGSARAQDEYRVQLTGVVPSQVEGQKTLLLGWHAGYGVFVGFDIRRHDGQDSRSPSIQVKEETLQNAHTHAFAIHHRHNGEIAVAFRPEFLVEYALNAAALHESGEAELDISLLNGVDTLTEEEIITIKNQERQTVVSQISRKFRASDFRRRVLGAYGHRCAVCGVQLELIDAAHIIPVAASTSTDETRNGIALCKLHHAAYDRNLISFNESYKIEVSLTEVARLTSIHRILGLEQFKAQMLTAILLPNDRRDYPPAEYITEARKIRRWM